MKFLFAGFITFCFFATGCAPAASSATNQFDSLVVQSRELIPEGIAVHPRTGTIYLSSLHQNKIVSVDKNGNCKDLISSGQNGFMKGLGIKISNDGKTMWACTASLDTVKSVSGLFQVDLSTGKVIQSYVHQTDSASLFNDLAIHSSGEIYLTDTYQGAVFRYQPGIKKMETWLRSDQFKYANGIVFSDDETVLFLASGNNGVQHIDMKTKNITPVTQGKRTDYAIDGLVYSNKTLIGVIGWPQDDYLNHRVIRYTLNDAGYMEKADTLLINKPYVHAPTTAALYNNRLYVLARTNLGLYNKGKQALEMVRDSLQLPLIVQIPLR